MRFPTLPLLALTSLPLLIVAPALAQEKEKETDKVEEGEKKEVEDKSKADEEDTAEAKPEEENSKSEEEKSEGDADKEAASEDESEDSRAEKAASGEEAAVSESPEETEPEDEDSTADAEPDKTSIEMDDQDEQEPSESADEALTEEAAAAALTDMPDDAPSLTPLKLSTSTWTRFEIRENYDEIDVSKGRTLEGDLFVFRARLGIETNPLPINDSSDVLVKFAPQATGYWGQSGTIGEGRLGLYEGYFKVRSKRLDVQVGRMMMNYGDAVVIGNLDWDQRGRAFDGVRAHYKMKRGYVDFIGTQISEAYPNGAQRFLGGDTYFWGAYAGLGGYAGNGQENIDLDFYFLGLSGVKSNDLVDETGAAVSQAGGTLFTLGTRAKGATGPVDVRAEGGFQFGNQSKTYGTPAEAEADGSVSTIAYMADLEIGLRMGEQTRVALGGVVASGDREDTDSMEGWSQLFPTAHKFLGLMDVIGARTNILSGNVKFKRGITQSLTFKADGHVFSRVESQGTTDAGFTGIEVDTQLVQKLGKYALVRGLYGLFIPTTGQYPSDDLVSYGEIQAGVDF